MLPAFDDRRTDWPSHPRASRDSLHEAEMWVVEGLTHRYPTKVLAEMLSTCPQYCGHCTRMDLVGNSVPQVQKHRFALAPKDRYSQMLEYLRTTPSVRDVVVSGGDVANLPIEQLEHFVAALLDIPNIRDIRLASKGLMGIPQHFLQDKVLQALDRLALKAFERALGRRPLLVRAGGTLPIVPALVDKPIPTVLTGFALPESNAHSPNERMRVEDLPRAVAAAQELFRAWGDLG
jgi:lysine 2,3-aminomutase